MGRRFNNVWGSIEEMSNPVYSAHDRLTGNDALRDRMTQMMELIIQSNLSMRTGEMVLIGVNMASAALIVMLVYYDAWKALKTQPTLASHIRSSSIIPRLIQAIHPAEVVPLSVSAAVLGQGTVFLTGTSLGFSSVDMSDCKALKNVIFPAMWLFGFALLVFGIECAARSFGRDRFSPRGRWNITLCWIIIGLMLLIAWIPNKVETSHHDNCLADMLGFVSPQADFAFGMSLVLIGLYLLIAFTVAFQLYRTVDIERAERISASRMVYYLVLGAIILTLVVPLWADLTFLTLTATNLKYGMAIVALNIFGILSLFLHILLRANPDRMAIYPRSLEYQRNWRWRLFGASELWVSSPVESQTDMYFQKPEWKPIDDEVGVAITTKWVNEYEKILPLPPAYTPPKSHRRKISNYSVFPTKESARAERISLSTIEGSSVADDGEVIRLSTGSLQAPQPLFASGRRRQNSEMSTTTVQIGLRISNFESSPEIFASSPIETRDTSGSFLLGHRRPSGLRQVVSTASNDTYDISAESCCLGSGAPSPALKEAFLAPPARIQLPAERPKLVSLPSSPKASKMAVKSTIDRNLTMKNLPPYPAPAAKTYNERNTDESPFSQSWPLTASRRDSTEALLPGKVVSPTSGWI